MGRRPLRLRYRRGEKRSWLRPKSRELDTFTFPRHVAARKHAEPSAILESSASFPKFMKLPPEIRRTVWQLALDVNTPRAYVATVGSEEYNSHRRRAKWYRSAPVTAFNGPPPKEACQQWYTPSWTLKETCHEAYNEVTRIWAQFKPKAPAFLATPPSVQADISVHEGVPTHSFLPPDNSPCIRLDAEKDLVVLDMDMTLLGSPPALDSNSTKHLCLLSKLAAFCNPNEPWDTGTFQRLSFELMDHFCCLEKYYLLIKPDQLADLKSQSFPKIGSSFDAYLAAEETTGRNEVLETFQTKERQLYELSNEEVSQMGKLHIFLQFLNERREKAVEQDPSLARVSLRFMSWKWHQG
ncbi:hypothetical protein FALBO_11920 [Fusarium albosuccineum]|uniref:2EXR domain-containing protein n=1 Tax=Fusarium albosuccineum TaxID=1237068 RepID=A0A8H4P8H0_9HYPO|nr:hypothetical protein FALBO_11920 [Fusarium albosuccineum]